MKKAVYLFAVCLFSYIRSGTPTSFETVWLKDVTTMFQTDKRTLIDPDLPNNLTFHLTRGSDILTLDLKRNHNINPDADVYFARTLKNGQSVLVKSRNYEKETHWYIYCVNALIKKKDLFTTSEPKWKLLIIQLKPQEDVAYYQDRENWAYMTVKCVKKSNEPCDRIINGNLRIGDRSYDLEPGETDVTSRNFVETLGDLGKQYVLKDQPYMRRGYSVQKKDKSRELSNPYFVKVAVLIDSSAWNFYLSTVHQLNILTRSRNTKRKIKQIFSHMFNGVNLLYKGIEDPGLSVNVILSKFVFFKSYTEFPYNISIVTYYNKTYYIDVLDYLHDIEKWDLKVGAKYQPVHDHGMFISRYTLYKGTVFGHIRGSNYIGGLTYTGQVCEVGLRNSIIMIDDFHAMMTTVTHELAHSLGADHDGEREASDCRAEDQFIMTAVFDPPDPQKPYSKNPWLFSTCSVRLMKQTLKDKACVTIPGDYYNAYEYTQHVINEAGVVFPANTQCELNNGQRSRVCETPIETICRFMRCTDPKTGICNKKYYSAARGTECGPRKMLENTLIDVEIDEQ